MGGRSTHTHDYGQRIAGMTIQTSLLGEVIPIGWGRGRLSCNLIDYVAFTAVPHTTTTSTSSGGKGGGGTNTTSTTTYTYTASIELAICDGPIAGIRGVWKDAAYFTGAGAVASAGLSGVTLGNYTQTAWPYLTSLYPAHALAYRGISYAYAQNYDMGANGIVANHGFEIDFAVQFNPAGGVYDANPKDILTDFLTNVNYGVPSWPASSNGDWTDYGNYCSASNILLSPVLDKRVTAAEFVRRIMDQTHSNCFFSEGLLKIKPLGDASVTGNGVTWVPALTPVYGLKERDFLGEVHLEIVDQAQTYNYIQVEFLSRANQYQTAITIAYDLDDIVTYGRRTQTSQQFHDICDPQIARNVAQLWLQRNLFIRDLYQFTLPMDFCLLEPMDYVSLTTTVDGMKLTGQLAMIKEISEDQEGQDILHIVAEGVPGQTASFALYPDHSPFGVGVDPNANPGSVATPYIWNAPQSLTVNGYEVWAAVCGTNANWGGAVVWGSFDNVNYTPIGSARGPSRYGTLTAALISAADPDSTHTLSVDLTISAGKLATVTHAEADAGASLCWVGGELIDYGTATLTATSKYDLTYLRRGQQGSVIGAHSIGDQFVRLDGALFKYPYLAQNSGKTVYLKFQSYNVYGRGLQDLSTCTVYSVAAAPTASVAGGLALAGGGTTWVGNAINVVCNPVAGATGYRFDFYKADGTTLVRSITSSSPSASYLASTALSDGALRQYKISVATLTSAGAGASSAQLNVTNAAPAAVGSPAAAGGATTATVSCTASYDTDLSGYVVFYSGTSGFNPATTGGVVRSGTNSIDVFGLAAGTYYCKIAAYDSWSSNPSILNLSAEMSFAITTGGGSSPSGGGSGGGGYGGSGHPALV